MASKWIQLADGTRCEGYPSEEARLAARAATALKKRIKHKDKIKAQVGKWYRANRERVCANVRSRYQKNRRQILDSRKDERRAYYLANQKKFRGYTLMREYGLTMEEYEKMLARQNNCCAVCDTPFGSGRAESPRVDHDHDTGAIRGIVCHRCNTGIGLFRESAEIAEKAAKYLRGSK